MEVADHFVLVFTHFEIKKNPTNMWMKVKGNISYKSSESFRLKKLFTYLFTIIIYFS